MKKSSFLIQSILAAFLLAFTQVGLSQDLSSVWNQYAQYKEPALNSRFFKHSDIVPLIQKHAQSTLFRHKILGNSVQGRSIHHLAVGRGKTKILLWSQMHGDETTATRSLFDLFNFFTAKNDENTALRKFLLDKLELHFVPMVNPDGAEMYKRRNTLDIDINRDARMQVTPEGTILMDIAKELQPEFGFNLHDQSTLYSAGATRNTATISFLAPAYNYEKSMNEVRKKATQVIVLMNNALQRQIPGKVAKYDDAHDPRCFGDTFQGMDISTILIESGGFPGDPEKEHIRKLNFYSLLSAFEAIARQSYLKEDYNRYADIPENGRSLYDVLIRNVTVTKAGNTFTTNLGINRSQIKSADYRSISYQGNIDELGDVDFAFGYDEADAKDLIYTPALVKVMTKNEWEGLKPADELKLIKEGYLFVKWLDEKSLVGPVSNRLLNLTNSDTNNSQAAGLNQTAHFLLTKNNKPVYAVINGFLVNLEQPAMALPNTYGY
ncbi:MAG TPA: M14 family zinc carboxypeptidase [Sphingobacteriaceae bacterium]|nr:M14 family zinc carboxypeptidase [Sphingobacteriaceae bacterium]